MFTHFHELNGITIMVPNSCVHTVTIILPQANSCPTNTDSISGTAVGLIIGGVAAGSLGVLLIVGIVCGTCCLRKTKHK